MERALRVRSSARRYKEMGIVGGIALLVIMGLVFLSLIVLALLGALAILALIGVFTLAMIGALAYVIGRLLRLW